MYTDFISRATKKDVDALVQVEQLAWATPGEFISASREKISLRIPGDQENQSAVLAMVNSNPAGSQYAFRFNWNRNIASLTSWDEHTNCGWTHSVHDPRGNTGFLVGVGVVPGYRGERVEHSLRWKGRYKISELLLALTLDNLFFPPFGTGVEYVIANARIPFYHKHPELSADQYCLLLRNDGLPFDPVLRFHVRMRARIIKPVAYSMDDAESLNGGCWVMYTKPFDGF